MILAISQRLGLASIGERYFGSKKPETFDGIEVTEFVEYTNAQLCADAREMLASSYAQTTRHVLESRQ